MAPKIHICKPINFFILLSWCVCFFIGTRTFADQTISLQTPLFTHVESNQTDIISNEDHNVHFIKKNASYPLTLNFSGPLGGLVEKTFQTQMEVANFILNPAIIADKNSHPEKLITLPALCPRMTLSKNSNIPLYLGQFDRLNHIPSAQLLDPDVKKGEQYKGYTEIDGKNVLLLKRVRITNDYEDSSILDYSGPNPLTGKPEDIYEGEGGFYANIHYAIIPYQTGLEKLGTQELLHLAQGKLDEINRNQIMPTLRIHSFLPGPFLSKSGAVYDMCEWGDTTYQAPVQEMEYQNMALWDWDYSVPKADHIILIVWEGDEEDWMIRDQLISPFTLTDDLIGVFEIRRKNTLEPLTLTNINRDFAITVETGDLDILNK